MPAGCWQTDKTKTGPALAKISLQMKRKSLYFDFLHTPESMGLVGLVVWANPLQRQMFWHFFRFCFNFHLPIAKESFLLFNAVYVANFVKAAK